MRQLGELQKHAKDFEELNAKLIFVFREETGGVEALEKIRERHSTEFTLTLDLEKKSTLAYSTEKMTFDNYIVGKDGKVVAAIDGTLRERATAEELMKILKRLEAGEAQP